MSFYLKKEETNSVLCQSISIKRRRYRQNADNIDKGLRLLKMKYLKRAIREREQLHEYSGDWYDIFDTDTNQKINLMKTI